MNISNALFTFTQQIVQNAPPDSIAENADIHTNIYEPFKPGATIRIDDLRAANPVWDGAKVRLDNAFINIQFLFMPLKQTTEEKNAARQKAEDLKDYWLSKMFKDPKLSDLNNIPRVCLVGKVTQFNDWIKPGTVLMPVCVLRLQINPR